MNASIGSTEEAGSTPVQQSTPDKDSAHGFLDDFESPLSLEDAGSTAGIRFMVAELKRRQQEIRELKEFREKYYSAAMEANALKIASKPGKVLDILASISLSMGSLLFGLAIKGTMSAETISIGIVGAILIVAGICTVIARSFWASK